MLDRRVGIPITLAVLGMEVGRRIGVPLSGVGMPGHFLVRDKVDPAVFIDPFNAGRELDADGCRALHRAMAGPARRGTRATWSRSSARPSWPASWPTSGSIYQRSREIDSLRWAVRLRCAMPGATAEDRQRARPPHGPSELTALAREPE